MKKVLVFLSLLLVTITLSGCQNAEVSLAGEATIELKRGSEFVDPGVLVDGEENDEFEVSGTVDVDTIGTYELTYSHDKYDSLSRTVTIIMNEEDLLFKAITDSKEKTNFELYEYVDIEFSGPGGVFTYYSEGTTQVNGVFSHVDAQTDMVNSFLTIIEGYGETEGDDYHMFLNMGSGFVYGLEEFDYTFLYTTVVLEEIEYISFELNGTETVYTVNFKKAAIDEDFKAANGFLGQFAISKDEDYKVAGTITVENGLIKSINYDLGEELSEKYERDYGVTIDMFDITYSYSKYDEVEEIVIPAHIYSRKD